MVTMVPMVLMVAMVTGSGSFDYSGPGGSRGSSSSSSGSNGSSGFSIFYYARVFACMDTYACRYVRRLTLCSTPVSGQIKVKNWVYMVVIPRAITTYCPVDIAWYSTPKVVYSIHTFMHCNIVFLKNIINQSTG